MSNKLYDSFKELHKGKYDWKVPCRVMNLWRGFTREGEPFKSFNLLLLDHKRCRIHAFVPANVSGLFEKGVEVGGLYLLKNFTVKDYRAEDKFRPVMKENCIVLGKDSKISSLDEKDICVERAVFDFYDLGDLKELSTQSTYLTDVIGVIQEPEIPLSKFTNKHNQQQTQVKFHIYDGNHTVKVTFWDAFAELLDEMIDDGFERPLIIIIGCGRVTQWNEKVDISNVGATTFLVNSNHHSVTQLRNMLKKPEFADFQLRKSHVESPKLLTVRQLTEAGDDFIEKYVYCKLTLQEVKTTDKWFTRNCTSCYKQTSFLDNENKCSGCNRTVPYPMKWFEIYAVAMDGTGEIEIILNNCAGQKCYGKDVFDIEDKKNEKLFPTYLKTIEKKSFLMKLLVKKENTVFKSRVYMVEDVVDWDFSTFIDDKIPRPLEESYAEASTSSANIGSLSVT